MTSIWPPVRWGCWGINRLWLRDGSFPGLTAAIHGVSLDTGSALLPVYYKTCCTVGPGEYILSSVKKVVSSEDFDKMSPAVQNCQFEQTWAECRRTLFLTQATLKFKHYNLVHIFKANFSGNLPLWLLPPTPVWSSMGWLKWWVKEIFYNFFLSELSFPAFPMAPSAIRNTNNRLIPGFYHAMASIQVSGT